MNSARALETIWRGRGAGPALARGALAPAEAVYRVASAARGALYGAGFLRTLGTALPAISVGNLSVGGTGKTPVAAWIAGELLDRGARPAVVSRGYGGDEALVHAALNPTVPVITSSDRVAGIDRAKAAGADVAVLDDAFQHRRARRVADVVLVSADTWDGRTRLLPAGPWREPPTALRRASIVLVTRKAAGEDDALGVARCMSRYAPRTPAGVVRIAIGALRRVLGAPSGTCEAEDAERPLHALVGARILAISAIGDPDALRRQLEAFGALVDPASFRDHHRFTAADARILATRGRQADVIVCTLKDAVKLRHLWPREGPQLWYVTQRVAVERGWAELDRVLRTVLNARALPPIPDAAGASGRSTLDHGH